MEYITHHLISIPTRIQGGYEMHVSDVMVVISLWFVREMCGVAMRRMFRKEAKAR